MTSLLSLVSAAAVGSALAVLTGGVSQGDAFMIFCGTAFGLVAGYGKWGKT